MYRVNFDDIIKFNPVFVLDSCLSKDGLISDQASHHMEIKMQEEEDETEEEFNALEVKRAKP